MIIDDLKKLKETCFRNPLYRDFDSACEGCELTYDDVEDASKRLERFAAYFKKAFPETAKAGGIIESPFKEIPIMKKALEDSHGVSLDGRLFLKMDSHLPISGSVKARGGVYEVLKFAEDVAIENGLISYEDDYSAFDSNEFRNLFSRYSIAVGSTGNLGLSIGIISAKLGFNVTVHMSSDAREWKKNMLKSKGVSVKEYSSDYSEAVRQGRISAEKDPFCHFVDDENSRTLFLGYSVAAKRLKKQLDSMNITIDENHPLMIYLPCGVGGGPGGVAFGLKQIFKDNVHCFFAEPTHACCMTLGMATGLHNEISVKDIGIDGVTIADGLAVGRASGFVGRFMEPFIGGCYTVSDERMFNMLTMLADTENVYLEPSALAGMRGPILTKTSAEFSDFVLDKEPIHVVWATGGGMVPEEEMRKYYLAGKSSVCN